MAQLARGVIAVTTATEEKPGRLLTTGAVQITFATEHIVSARVRGDSGPIYDVRWSRMAGWDCTCPLTAPHTHRRRRSGDDPSSFATPQLHQ